MIVRTVIKGAAMGEEMRNCMYAEAEEDVMPVSWAMLRAIAVMGLVEVMLLAGIAWLIWGRA